jgi:adenosylhomocysteine nucleosidase
VIPATPPVPHPAAVGLVAALPEELRTLRRRLEAVRSSTSGGFRFDEGSLSGAAIVAVETGTGEASAAAGARALLDRFRVRGLVVLGLGGGLSPALGIGSLFVAERVVDERGPAPAPDARWSEHLRRRTGARQATFFTASRPLATAASKRAAWRALGGDGPALVDLETAAVARVAASRGVPYAALRAVGDAAEDTLPLPFERFVDASGRIRRVALVAEALRRPRIVPGLLELHRRAAQCAERLADALGRAIEDGPR